MVVPLSQVVESLVTYFINNWNNYIVNIYYPNVIRITYRDIHRAFCKLFPSECNYGRRQRIPAKVAWIFGYLKYEFELRGYKVEKRKIRGGKTALYIHKA